MDGTEYGRKDAIPVQVGTVITLKVGNDGDAAPETYTIALQAAGTLLSGDNVSLTSIHQDGSAGTKVALTFRQKPPPSPASWQTMPISSSTTTAALP